MSPESYDLLLTKIMPALEKTMPAVVYPSAGEDSAELVQDGLAIAAGMIWQDFAMACALYPQDTEFCRRLEQEARAVVRRLRQHACLVLWAGDNECDSGYVWWWRVGDPNNNVLTRRILPDVLRTEDPYRPYIPSSPYIDRTVVSHPERYLPENHLWGPRDYYKSDFYKNALCCFVSEIGYHGCPDAASIRQFISPDKVWPYKDNAEWILHSTYPLPAFLDHPDPGRMLLMANQVRELFGQVPETLDDFVFASQASQAEAKKFFIEHFRGTKWRRTGIIWWNLLDAWPQFSDAIVDYYWRKKLAYGFVKTSQQHLCLVLREPENWGQDLVACNDLPETLEVTFTLRDSDTDEILAKGSKPAAADDVTVLARIPFSMGAKRFYAIDWTSCRGPARNHYLAGMPPFDLGQYRRWLTAYGTADDQRQKTETNRAPNAAAPRRGSDGAAVLQRCGRAGGWCGIVSGPNGAVTTCGCDDGRRTSRRRRGPADSTLPAPE